MAEAASTASNTDSFPKGLDIYESFDQVTTGNVRRKTTPIGVAEDGTRVPLTDEHILHSYGYGPEDLPPKAAKKNKQWVKPIEVVDASAEEVEEIPIEKLVPASDFQDKHSVETEDGFPMRGVWEGHSGDQPVTVEKSYGVGGDGKIYYKVKESETGVPADQLKFYVSESAAPDGVEAETLTTDEATDEAEAVTTKVETEKSAEKLRREAIDPERILELKDRFEREYSQELALHNIKTEEDKKKDPWLVESSAEHVRNKILREYLKIAETDWDPEELAEIREDVINMMKMSQRSLQNLMLKPESEEPADEWPTRRTTVEPGPTPIEPEPVAISPEPVVVEPEPDERTRVLITDPEEQRKGLLARLRDRMRRGKTSLNTVIYENITDKEKVRKRRLIIIGVAAASAVAGALGFELLEHHHLFGLGDHDATGTGDLDKHLEGTTNNGTDIGGNHHEIFNNDGGTRTVESVLPDNLKQTPTGLGYEHIIDKNTGQTVVDHVTYAENGRYSTDTIHQLNAHDYNVGTNTVEIHDTTGPGPHGDITHKVSVVEKAQG